MWTTILEFLAPYTTKYLLPILIGVCLVLLGICLFLRSANNSLTKEVVKLETEMSTLVQVYENERLTSKAIIEEQNNAIKAYKLDLDEYKKTIGHKEKEILEASIKEQQKISDELKTDNSAANQLKIISNILKDFANE